MGYDLAILVVMATAIGGILYAEYDTAKRDVRYIGQTRVHRRPVEDTDQPHSEVEAPDFHMSEAETNSLGADPMRAAKGASSVAEAKGAASIVVQKNRTTWKSVAWTELVKNGEIRVRTSNLRETVTREEKIDAGDPFDLSFRRQEIEAMGRALSHLRERERLIIVLYYQRELTMKQIADSLGLDESRVSQIHSAALRHLRAYVLARPGSLQVRAATADRRGVVVKQEKILEYYGQTFGSMERRLRRLEEKAAQRRERATGDEP